MSGGANGAGGRRNPARAALMGAALAAFALVPASGCGSHPTAASHPDGSIDVASPFDARDVAAEMPASIDAPVDAPAEASTPDAQPCSDAGVKRNQGQTCGCDADCTTSHCVDGVCCNSACGESCKTCAAPAAIGTCTSRAVGAMPRDASACVKSEATSCGWDGTCDGAGACRRWVSGTVCKACSGRRRRRRARR